jgi:hypothetical protein
MDELEQYLKRYPDSTVAFRYLPDVRAFRVSVRNIRGSLCDFQYTASELEARHQKFFNSRSAAALALHLALLPG